MKNLLANLKGDKLKQLAINHGEKLVVGIIGLVVLAILATTSWSGYQRKPEEIVTKVDQSRQQIDSSKWPDEERSKLPPVSFLEKARQVMQPMQLGSFAYTTKMQWPLYRPQELAKEPELLPVEQLIATAGDVPLAMRTTPSESESSATGTEVASTETKPADDQENLRFKLRQGGTGFEGSFVPGGGAASPFGQHGMSGGQSSGGAAGAGGQHAVLPGGEHGMDGAGMEGDMYGMGMGTPNVKASGKRYIAVRGVFPVEQQLRRFQKALNLQSWTEARQLLELIDFTLERQMAVPGADPWSGDWQTVDIENALEVLRETAGQDPDKFDLAMFDPVITMPLPQLVFGYWDEEASHPKIKDAQLTPEQIAKEMAAYQTLIEERQKLAGTLPPKPVTKKGFSGFTHDVRSYGEELMGSEYAPEVQQHMAEAYYGYGSGEMAGGAMPMQQGAGLPRELQEKLMPGKYMLFRYFDFDVEPGRAYRYRVRLELRNPNFNRPIEQVVDPAIVEGETRETPWSNISTPVMVPRDVHVFLADVARDPMRDIERAAAQEDRSKIETRKKAIADFRMIQYDPEVGTMLDDVIRMDSFGAKVGGKKDSMHLDFATRKFEKESVTFSSRDVLLDAFDGPQISAANHPDLQLDNAKAKSLVPDEVLVVDQFGHLKELDPLSKQKELKAAEQRVNAEREAGKTFEKKKKEGQSALDLYAAEGGEMDMDMYAAAMMGAKGKKGKRQGNALQKR